MPGEFELLSPDALASLRALNESNLPHLATITIEKQSGARVGGALVDPTPEEWDSDVPCRLSPSGAGSPLNEGDQSSSTSAWLLAFKAGYEIPENATAIVTGETNGLAWTRTLRIIATIQTRKNAMMARYNAIDLGAASR